MPSQGDLGEWPQNLSFEAPKSVCHLKRHIPTMSEIIVYTTQRL